MEELKIHISTATVLKLLGVFLALYILYLVLDILLILFVALILAALIDPFADWFQRRKIPRGLAVLVIYIVLFGVISAAILLLVPIISQDLPLLVNNLGKFWINLQDSPWWREIVASAQNVQQTLFNYGFEVQPGAGSAGTNVKNTLSGVFSTISGFFGGVLSLVLVLVLTFYMVVQEDPLKKILRSIVPDEYIPWCAQLLKKIRDKLGAWVRGQMLLSLVVGAAVFIGLTILGVRYAALLAILAALLEFIPYLGPVLAALPALLLAFGQGGLWKLIFVLLMYFVIQQLENHLLVPKVMQKAVGLNPVIIIVALLAGAKLAGVLGAVIAIPVATALSVFVQDVLAKKN